MASLIARPGYSLVFVYTKSYVSLIVCQRSAYSAVLYSRTLPSQLQSCVDTCYRHQRQWSSALVESGFPQRMKTCTVFSPPFVPAPPSPRHPHITRSSQRGWVYDVRRPVRFETAHRWDHPHLHRAMSPTAPLARSSPAFHISKYLASLAA